MNLNFGFDEPVDEISASPTGKTSGKPITDFPRGRISHFVTAIFVTKPIPYEGGQSSFAGLVLVIKTASSFLTLRHLNPGVPITQRTKAKCFAPNSLASCPT